MKTTNTQCRINFILLSIVVLFLWNVRADGVFPIATNNPVDFGLGIAFGGTNYLVAIEGDEIDTHSVTAQLFSTQGALVGSRIKTGHRGGVPFAASSGANYLLVWPDKALLDEHVYAQLIGASGVLIGPAISIATAFPSTVKHCNPVAYGAGKYLVVWK